MLKHRFGMLPFIKYLFLCGVLGCKANSHASQVIQSAVKQSEAAWVRIICASRPIIIKRENDC